jgi:hypothetical protein
MMHFGRLSQSSGSVSTPGLNVSDVRNLTNPYVASRYQALHSVDSAPPYSSFPLLSRNPSFLNNGDARKRVKFEVQSGSKKRKITEQTKPKDIEMKRTPVRGDFEVGSQGNEQGGGGGRGSEHLSYSEPVLGYHSSTTSLSSSYPSRSIYASTSDQSFHSSASATVPPRHHESLRKLQKVASDPILVKPSLLLILFPHYFTLHHKGNFSYDRSFSELFSALDYGLFTKAIEDLLADQRCSYQNGGVVVEIRDYRYQEYGAKPSVRHMVLQSDLPLSIIRFCENVFQNTDCKYEETLELESALLAGLQAPLCLDPSTKVFHAAAQANYNKRKQFFKKPRHLSNPFPPLVDFTRKRVRPYKPPPPFLKSTLDHFSETPSHKISTPQEDWAAVMREVTSEHLHLYRFCSTRLYGTNYAQSVRSSSYGLSPSNALISSSSGATPVFCSFLILFFLTKPSPLSARQAAVQFHASYSLHRTTRWCREV